MFRGIGNPKPPEENDEVEKNNEATGMQPNTHQEFIVIL